jgi:hypothetical protein
VTKKVTCQARAAIPILLELGRKGLLPVLLPARKWETRNSLMSNTSSAGKITHPLADID